MLEYSRAELIDMRIQCDESLMFFTRLFFKELRGQKFAINWHHELICEKFQAVENYQARFFNINIPPRHSKTELAINFIARGLGQNPKGNYLYITASDELRSESSIRIRDIVSSELFQTLYGVRLKKDQQSKNVWRTEAGGGLKTATIFGQITGFGAGQMKTEHEDEDLAEYIRSFEGCIVLDDIDKIMDAESGNVRNKNTHSVIFNTILSRVNSMDTPIINIQQRAGEEDSTGVLLDHFSRYDKSKVISLVLPVIVDGKPLWESKMDMQEIESIKTSPYTSHVYETQYMQNPTSPKGKPFHRSKLKWFTSKELKKIKKLSEGCISYLDPKDQGDDFYCHVFGHIVGKVFYVTDVVHNQSDTNVTVPLTVHLIESNDCEHTVIETNSMGGMVYKWIIEETEKFVQPINNVANKETRIATFSAFICTHMRFLSDYEPNSDYATFIYKLTKYEYNKPNGIDDAPDATAGAAQLAMVKYRHLFETRKKKSGDDEEE